MARQRIVIGDCPKCQGNELACSYHRFEKEGLTIDSWEHKCPDCGFRETTAYRSDEPAGAAHADPRLCPYCARRV